MPQPSWALGDFDYNGFVDDDDVTLLGAFYNPEAPPLGALAPPSLTDVAAVPEPGTWQLLAIAIAVMSFPGIRFVFAHRLRAERK